MQRWLERRHLDTTGSGSELLARQQQWLRAKRDEWGGRHRYGTSPLSPSPTVTGSTYLMHRPRCLVVSQAVRSCVVLPVPGFYTEADWHTHLVVDQAAAAPTPCPKAQLEHVYEAYAVAPSTVKAIMQQRLLLLSDVVEGLLATVRAVLHHDLPSLLPSEVQNTTFAWRDVPRLTSRLSPRLLPSSHP